MFGRIYANPKIASAMTEHSVAHAKYSPLIRYTFKTLGPVIIWLFGYPLDMEIQRRVKPLMKLIKPKRGETILDVGCGVGYFTFEFSEGCKSFSVGLDIDKEDITLAGKVKRISKSQKSFFVAGSGLSLPFKENSFDKILASEIVEHIQDDAFFLRELSRFLKPGGLLVLTTPYDASPQEYTRWHFKKVKAVQLLGGHVRSGYSLKSLTEKLAGVGLELDEHAFSYGRFTRLARSIIKCCGWFGSPLAYFVSYLDEFMDPKEGRCIIASARKPWITPSRRLRVFHQPSFQS